MPKKKQEAEAVESGGRFGLAEDTRRSVFAIISTVLAIVFVLGFFRASGVAGEFFNRISGAVFGWGKWIFPFLLLLSAMVFLRRNIRFYRASIAGLSVSFFALLGVFHLGFSSVSAKKFASPEGGYIGAAIAKGLIWLTGGAAAWVILGALFLVGILVAFNVSAVPALSLMKRYLLYPFAKMKRKTNELEEGVDEKDTKSAAQEEDPTPNSSAQAHDIQKEDREAAVIAENMRNVRFQDDDPLPSLADYSIDNAFSDAADADDTEEREAPSPPKRRSGRSWRLPRATLLELSSGKAEGGDTEERKQLIADTLGQFGIAVEPHEVKVGPTVTQYSFRPAGGVRLEKITALSNNLALALAAHPIRIEAPIPGKPFIGIEVPNKSPEEVRMRNMVEDAQFRLAKSSLTVALGKDVSGEFVFADIASMPHLLVAGATGSGKSVCINAILLSLLYKNTPDQLQLILVDPKRVELSLYHDIPHLKTPVIVESKRVINALRWAVSEMDRRYGILQEAGVRNIDSYNSKVHGGQAQMFDSDGEEEKAEYLPYIVIVIDELADLMASHGKEVEGAIVRLAQMARAVGIHLIVSTQRPDVKVLTGLIKSNITTRIALKVATQIDSRTILDKSGAEKLVGKGDMLFMTPSRSAPQRIQSVYVTESEVHDVADHLRAQKKNNQLPEEESNFLGDPESETIASDAQGKSIDDFFGGEGLERDELFDDAKLLVLRSKKAATSLLQRHLRIGYGRAARIMDELEEAGVIGPADGSKPREILIDVPVEDSSESEQAFEEKRKMDEAVGYMEAPNDKQKS